MYALRLPTGEFLDVPRGLTLPVELNNQVFSTGNTTVLPGSFTFPAELPLSNANKIALGNPQLVNNARRWRKIEGVQVYCHGIALFEGTLTIQDCTPSSVSVSVIANGAAPLKDVMLAGLDLEGERFIGLDDDEVRSHMNATAVHPSSYDYAFFPVQNRSFRTLPALPDDTDYFQNFYKRNTETFLTTASAGLTPFVRVDYLLRRMFAQTTYTFANLFQNTLELRRLYVYNNYDMREPNDAGSAIEIPSVIRLRNHVPEMKCTDFLRNLMAAFCLGLFTNVFDKSIKLIPLRDVLRRPPQHDWSDYVLAGYTLSYDNSGAPAKLCWEPRDAADLDVRDDIPLQSFTNFNQFLLAVDTDSIPEGYYYLDMEEIVVEAVERLEPLGTDLVGVILGHKRKCHRADDSPHLESNLSPLKTSFYNFGVGDSSLFLTSIQEGKYVRSDANGNLSRSGPDTEACLMFYRGIQQTVSGGDSTTLSPYSSNDIYSPLCDQTPPAQIIEDGSPDVSLGDAQYSLLWHQPQGLYNQWWKLWHNALYTGKTVTESLAIPVAALTAFSFEDKVKINNMDFFVKKLRVGKALSGARVLVEATLVSVI